MKTKAYLAAAIVALSPVAASAASVNIAFEAFAGPSEITDAISARDAFIGNAPKIYTETFDGFTACPATNCDSTSPSLDTNVGKFTRFGTPVGSGSSNVTPNDQVVVRSGNPDPFGRFDVEGSDDNWLDSNDHMGIQWDIPGNSGLSDIVRLAFFLIDVDDVGNFGFNIDAVGGDVASQVIESPMTNTNNANLQLVKMSFDRPIDLVSINMEAGRNDGFGVDGLQVASVPLPAAGVLLLGALGGLGGASALRRRRKTA